jgi:O-acetyl-ADP-ribose deacetylase (regulator of RNase III)
MRPRGGADAAIHEAAGPKLLEYCQRLGGVSVGEAKITPAFNLPCKYVIHTAGPEWEDGLAGERVLLRSCYKESMKLAISYNCKSVAFPLIASGLYGYPKERVLKEATDVLGKFLKHYEIDVYIVVFDKTAYSISRELYEDVRSFVDNFYVEMHSDMFDNFREDDIYREHEANRSRRMAQNKCIMPDTVSSIAPMCAEIDYTFQSKRLNNMLENMDKGFAETLFDYIDKKGITDVEAYKRSNVGKKTFSKIKCNKDYKPSKITAVSFAIGLHLNLEETKHLLSTAGMCLSRSNKFDVIIEYFITKEIYDIFLINETLFEFDQVCLGVIG